MENTELKIIFDVLKIRQQYKNKKAYVLAMRKFMKYPKMIENDYFTEIMKKTNAMIKVIQKRIVPKIPDYVKKFKEETKTAKDDINDDINNDMKNIEKALAVIFGTKSLKTLAAKYADLINKSNKSQLKKMSESLFGVNLFQSEDWIDTTSKFWIEQNVNLIKSISENQFDKVRYIVREGIAEGKTVQEIQSNILNSVTFNKTEPTIKGARLINPTARSLLIARDQVGKFYQQMNQYRQQAAGIDSFIWDAVNDERTRPEHAVRDSKIYTWKDGDDGVYPGYEYQCRCVALPVFPGIDFSE